MYTHTLFPQPCLPFITSPRPSNTPVNHSNTHSKVQRVCALDAYQKVKPHFPRILVASASAREDVSTRPLPVAGLAPFDLQSKERQ